MVSWPRVAVAQEQADRSAARDVSVEFALRAMQHSLERLDSGVYRGQGLAEIRPAGGAPRKHEVRVFSAFDGGSGAIRFDKYEQRLDSTTPGAYGLAPWRKVARTPEYELVWDGVSSASYRAPAQDRVGNPATLFLDPRTCGLVNEPEQGLPLAQVLSWLRPRFLGGTATTDENGFVLLDARSHEGTVGHRLWLDPQKGYVPIRMEQYYTATPTLLIAESQTAWIKDHDVWVPRSLRLTQRSANIDRATGAPLPPSEATYSLDFDWERVNAPVSSRLFHWQGFDLPPGTHVFDRRLGKNARVDVAVVGDDNLVRVSPPARWPWAVPLTLAALLLAAALALYYRQHRPRPRTGA